MQYDLDPRLLPPSGVSVQCTRCRFVFTATASAVPEQPPAPGPVPAPMTGAPKQNTTFIFGKTRPEPAPAASSPGVTQTAKYGVGPSAGSEHPSAPSQTQIFGKGELADVVARAEAASASAPISLPPEILLEALSPSPEQPQRPEPRPPPLELPPELLASASPRPRGAPVGVSRRKENKGLYIIGILGVLILLAALAYPVWSQRVEELPAEVLAARDEVAVLLRRDDAASREQAISRLRVVLSNHPNLVEAQADLALALGLALDDLQVEIERLKATEARLEHEAREVGASKARADWAIHVNAMNDEIAALRNERESLAQRLQGLLSETAALQRALQTAPSEEPRSTALARVRAQAVLAGVRGESHVRELTELLRAMDGASTHWATVARAEYVLNAELSPSALGEVAVSLESVREQERTFLRAYLLGARAAMRLGDEATARRLLDEALTLNPNHTLAEHLREWAMASQREVAPSP